MSATFFSGWTVTMNNAAPIDVPVKSQYCRDVAYYAMVRELYKVFNIRRNIISNSGTDTRAAALAWWKWLREHDPRFTCTTAQPAPHNAQWMREYSIPLIIGKLQNKFPSVEFTQTTYQEGFSGRDMPAIDLRGDSEIVPAFYWSTYLVRLANAEGLNGFISSSGKTVHDWQAVNALIARRGYSEEHTTAWAALCEGIAPSGLMQLVYQAGPISAVMHGLRTPITDEALAEFMSMPLYSRWFADESA